MALIFIRWDLIFKFVMSLTLNINNMATTIINDYFAKNDSVPVMDSLLMNQLTIKTLVGLPTTDDPIVGNRYDTVNSRGEISAVTGKSVTLKADPGFKLPGDAVVPVNSRKPLNLGFYHFEDGYNTQLGILQKNIQRFNRKGVPLVEPPLFGPPPEPEP
jgi:hypothetical protein